MSARAKIHQIALTLCSVLLLGLTACHTTKITTETLNGPNPERARYESVVQNNYRYEALQSKVKLGMGSTSLSGKMCLESGQRVCMALNAPIIGFEIGRVEATQQSVLLVDKYDKIYSVVQLADLYQIQDLNGHEMEALECIMLGRIYIPGRGEATSKDYSALAWSTPQLPDGRQGYSIGTYQGEKYSLAYSIDATGRLVSTRLTVDGKNVLWEYDKYQEVEKGKWLPTLETVTATDADQKTLTLSLALSNPALGESNWRDFEPTASYRQVTPAELKETLQKLAK